MKPKQVAVRCCADNCYVRLALDRLEQALTSERIDFVLVDNSRSRLPAHSVSVFAYLVTTEFCADLSAYSSSFPSFRSRRHSTDSTSIYAIHHSPRPV